MKSKKNAIFALILAVAVLVPVVATPTTANACLEDGMGNCYKTK